VAGAAGALPGGVELDLVKALEASSEVGEKARQTLGESLAVVHPESTVDFIAHFITPSIGSREAALDELR
jgi:hypothetical protein